MEKNDQKPRSKFGRRFDEEFKRDAVRMLESRVRTAQQLSEELGVSAWSLKRWAKLYAQEAAAAGRHMRTTRLTDMLIEVDNDIRFTDHFLPPAQKSAGQEA